MKIDTLKDLQKLIQLCRKEGIEAFELGEIKFNLGQKPKATKRLSSIADDFPEASIKIPQYNPIVEDNTAIKTDELTDEQKLMWSVRSEESQV